MREDRAVQWTLYLDSSVVTYIVIQHMTFRTSLVAQW